MHRDQALFELWQAFDEGRHELALQLINSTEGITEAFDPFGARAIDRAAQCGQPQHILALVSLGADINQANPITNVSPLMQALHRHDLPCLRVMLSSGAKLNQPMSGFLSQGWDSPLHLAVVSIRPDHAMISMLLDAGADPHLKGLDSRTPLDCAKPETRQFMQTHLDKAALQAGLQCFDMGVAPKLTARRKM